MDQLIQQAAEALGYPEGMVERSAKARASADGVSVEAVLTAWLGGEAPPPSAAPAASEPAAAAAPAASAAPPPEPSGPAVEELAPVGADESAEAPVEPEPEPEPEPVPAGGVPRWLAAVFIVVPLVALVYAMFFPNGPQCGDGGVLAIDPVTGEAVNCDGSEYGSAVLDFFAIGQVTYAQCSACHGPGGGGGSGFPAFTGGELLTTFPIGQCGDHVEWVAIGTLAWPEATYGATAKPVGGSGAQMPGFVNALSDVELRSVALYERVAFGGQAVDDALTDCGLVDEAGEMIAAG